jgi:hypothetical protein
MEPHMCAGGRCDCNGPRSQASALLACRFHWISCMDAAQLRANRGGGGGGGGPLREEEYLFLSRKNCVCLLRARERSITLWILPRGQMNSYSVFQESGLATSTHTQKEEKTHPVRSCEKEIAPRASLVWSPWKLSRIPST